MVHSSLQAIGMPSHMKIIQLTKDHVGNISPGIGVCNEGRDGGICSSITVEEEITLHVSKWYRYYPEDILKFHGSSVIVWESGIAIKPVSTT